MNELKICAVIPAKGKSRRLPNKNLQKVCGHPLVAWSIVQALCSKSIHSVWVTTDSTEIAEASRRYGATPMKRPEQDPDANGGIPIAYVVERLIEIEEPDYVVPMLPTSILRYPYDIDRLVEKMEARKVQRMVALSGQEECVVYQRIDELNCRTEIGNKNGSYLGQGNSLEIVKPQIYVDLIRSRPVTDTAIDNIAAETNKFLGYPETLAYHELEWWQGFDIDYRSQLETCGLLLEQRILRGQGMDVYFEYANIVKGVDYGLGIIQERKAWTPGENCSEADIWPGCSAPRVKVRGNLRYCHGKED